MTIRPLIGARQLIAIRRGVENRAETPKIDEVYNLARLN